MRITPDRLIEILEENNDYDDGANGWLRGGAVSGRKGVGHFHWYDDDADDRTKPVQKFLVTVTEVEL